MNMNWKWTSASVLVLAMVGCGGEESAEPTGVPSSAAPKTTPGAPSATKPEPTKSEPVPEPTAPESKKPETSKAAEDGPNLDGPKAENTKPGGASSLSAKQLAAIKQLPEAEQALALKQVVCPVGGGALGAMGKPFKVSFEGRSFYLCCDGCQDEVKADPKAIIAKLDNMEKSK
jgi:hypothetical protein